MTKDKAEAKEKQALTYKTQKAWESLGICNLDKGAITQILFDNFTDKQLDFTSTEDMHTASRLAVAKMQVKHLNWKVLKEDLQVMTTPKYAQLFEYCQAHFQKRFGTDPERKPGQTSPENKYRQKPENDNSEDQPKVQLFNPTQDAAEEDLKPLQKPSPSFIEDNLDDLPRSEPKVFEFRDQGFEKDPPLRDYFMQIFNVDLETVKLYRLNAQKLRLNEQTRTKLMEEREVLQEKLLLPLNFEPGDFNGAPAEKRQRLD